MLDTKTFTLRDVANALINDPTPKAKGSFFKRDAGGDDAYVSVTEATSGEREVFDYSLGEYKIVKTSDLTIGATCALGGAAVQLGIDPEGLLESLNTIHCSMGLTKRSAIRKELSYGGQEPSLGSLIYNLNDGTSLSKAELGRRIIDKCAPFLDVVMSADEVKYHAKFAGRDN